MEGTLVTVITKPGTCRAVQDIDYQGSATKPRFKGTISVCTGVEYAEDSKQYTNGISFTYTGSNPSAVRWLQFVWREILLTSMSGQQSREDSDVDDVYKFTTDPDKPSYKIDSVDPADPTYGSRGSQVRGPDHVTMVDSPVALLGQYRHRFGSEIKSAVSMAHFDTYILCGSDIGGHIAWSAQYSQPPKDQPTYVSHGYYLFPGALPKEVFPGAQQLELLKSRYPKWQP
jgi:hypothetical protein